jgi:hypothetical protein
LKELYMLAQWECNSSHWPINTILR